MFRCWCDFRRSWRLCEVGTGWQRKEGGNRSRVKSHLWPSLSSSGFCPHRGDRASLPHPPTAVMFYSGAWGQVAVDWNIWNMGRINLSFKTYFRYNNVKVIDPKPFWEKSLNSWKCRHKLNRIDALGVEELLREKMRSLWSVLKDRLHSPNWGRKSVSKSQEKNTNKNIVLRYS